MVLFFANGVVFLNVFHCMLLLEITNLLLLLYYHISRIWVNEIITTSAFRVDLEKSSAGSFKEPLLSIEWREKSCYVAARIMRRGRLGHQLRQMQSGMKTSMMAMHDNVQLLLVKLRLKADICHMWHWTC